MTNGWVCSKGTPTDWNGVLGPDLPLKKMVRASMQPNRAPIHSFQTDSEPGNIGDLYEELESSVQAAGVINRCTANEAGWLARYIRERSLRGRETISEEIEQELQVGGPWFALLCTRGAHIPGRKRFHLVKCETSGF